LLRAIKNFKKRGISNREVEKVEEKLKYFLLLLFRLSGKSLPFPLPTADALAFTRVPYLRYT
jgi:hypothetical protein